MQFLDLISRSKDRLAGLLLLVLSAYYVNTSMFYHSHEIDGETIFHSHFFSNQHSDSNDGGHTIDVIKLISTLSNFALEEQNFDSHICSAEPRLESVAAVESTRKAELFVEPCRSLRAPPVL